MAAHALGRSQSACSQVTALLVDDLPGLYGRSSGPPRSSEALAMGAHCLQSQGTQKRSLPVSSATRNVALGVPTATSA